MKCAASLRIDLRCHAGERGKLFGIEERFVDALRAGFEIDFLMKRGALLICCRAWRFFHGLLRRDRRDPGSRSQTDKRQSYARDGLPAREGMD